ncbi:5'/3'-nucleotidase SurE [Novosphingobium sp. PY1]|jgi:5'-nucleotidase|uniref:5'/3'-nucleotidase SurE n=1 Tax=Novosphingobium sp. PY1 TaxID=1882221 RepID=UPI001A8C179A|nr:5'/3'-nucleotidase SurE [Novosphingobium sp. PY1]GFM28813.1 acid phosphatase [Novosphingobium sp. PY1]
MHKRLGAACLPFLLLAAQAADARNIVIANDDGLTSNVIALYNALKSRGDDVIVSVPCTGQSGMGAAVKFLRPLGPLAQDCHNGAAPKGAPAVGPIERPGIAKQDFHYVDGTPVMALLYGIDVLAQKRWGHAPDLVLSGPNEGQNIGSIIVSSGTVNVVQYASARGIPAIALSAGEETADNKTLANPQSAEIASLSVKLLDALEKQASNKPLLPTGTSLNVNFPHQLENARWKLTRVGTYDAYGVHFVEDMSQSPMAKALGAGDVALPGIVIDMNQAKPTPAQKDDESVAVRDSITISVMQLGYGSNARTGQNAAKALVSRLSRQR